MKVDEISQSERRRVLANDRKVLSTYHAVAQGSIDDDRGGRFAVQKPTTVTGTGPISYPRLPSDSPSNQLAMTGQEMPLGYDINSMDCVGEFHERGDAAAPKVEVAGIDGGPTHEIGTGSGVGSVIRPKGLRRL
jgi:hypothetical protein